MSRSPTRILIIDDHPLFIDALKLALQPLLAEVGVVTARTLAEALASLSTEQPRLILLDLSLPDTGGVEGVACVREAAPSARLVVVSGRDDPVTVGLVKALGCEGFISKSLPLNELQVHLRLALAGRATFPEDASPLAAAVAALTPAQARVLAAAATGKLNKQIAHEMKLAEPTVKSHMSAIFKRLGVANRTQAILAITGRG